MFLSCFSLQNIQIYNDLCSNKKPFSVTPFSKVHYSPDTKLKVTTIKHPSALSSLRFVDDLFAAVLSSYRTYWWRGWQNSDHMLCILHVFHALVHHNKIRFAMSLKGKRRKKGKQAFSTLL